MQCNCATVVSAEECSLRPELEQHQEHIEMLDKIEPPQPSRIELEGFKRFSESLLWKLMRSFYDRQGALAWARGIVPHFITTNSFNSKAYTRVLQGFLADTARPCASESPMTQHLKFNPKEKFYIIELGAGSGKFSFLMLKALQDMRHLDFPLDNMVYVLTDFTQSNVKFWKGHPSLQPFLKTGQLDFAIFDAEKDDEIRLCNSGVVLCPRRPTANPICVIANYLFDTLCQDIFQVYNGGLSQVRK